MGFPARRSLLSCWESGEIPIYYEKFRLRGSARPRVGQISSISGAIKALIPGLKTRAVRPSSTPTPVGSRNASMSSST